MIRTLLHCALITAFVAASNGEYLIGLGSYDMTGPASDINMMGYASMEQVTAGIHFRLRARAFIVADGQQGNRVAFVNLDAGMASQLITIKVLERLKSRYGDLYNKNNVAISGTHTHAGPGGYFQYVVYSITSLGFVRQSFDVIVNAIEQCIVQAHNNLKPGSIFINKGDVANAGINRSPSAYLFNPPEERSRYPTNVDTLMTLLKFIDSKTNTNIGAFNWFATHGTSMSKANKLISGDNKGTAARLFEDYFSPSNSSNKISPISSAAAQACNETTSSNFKVRKSDGSQFVGAFCQSNVGDVTPNVLGAFCLDSGRPCDFNHSSCDGNDQLCVGHGPGYPDEIKSTRIIGERQFKTAVDLFESASEELLGTIDFRQVYLNFTNIEVDVGGGKRGRTCPAGLGPGFAAGTTDGPGAFGFQQGDAEINPFWKMVRDALKKPSPEQEECQKPKPVLLSTGEMFEPYAWAPAILPIQILKIGKLVILAVPGEFTTMAGRRLREAVKATLVGSGNAEFDNNTHIVIAGLSNTYSQYVATFEEYKQQRYEVRACKRQFAKPLPPLKNKLQAASTLYGPHTLSAYIQEFTKLASTLARKGEQPPKQDLLSPPDLSTKLISLVLPPLGDTTPRGKTFGDIKQDIVLPSRGWFTKGDKATATFYSANLRNDLLTEGTFASIEMLRDEKKNIWMPAYDDDDLCLFFKWFEGNVSSVSFATIEWEIPREAIPGVYRLRHFGASNELLSPTPQYFTGASSSFKVQ